MVDKVLIVDDDLETLRLVGLMLQRQGFEIVAASNGTQALGMARTEKPVVIILDIMMPDLDGYEVTRQLRKDPDTTNIPIILFTAKSQTEDKLVGYEAGADDYLTKPVHPAELIAKIKKLMDLGRSRETASAIHGHMIGVISAKGGSGVSSTAFNLALNLHTRTKLPIIAAELIPGEGTWGMELGFENPENLKRLLTLQPNEITAKKVDTELTQTTRGIKVLFASNEPKDLELICSGLQRVEIVQKLANLGPTVVLDLGTGSFPNFDRILPVCDEIVLVFEPNPLNIARTKKLLDFIVEKGFGKSKFLTLVQVNRIVSALQMSQAQISEIFKQKVEFMLPPFSEQAFNSFSKNIPLLEFSPNSLFNKQFDTFTDSIVTHIKG
jgi:CheY-like chemotaxis protein/MinD-like ATPase involved in chromosome partitioning or flagellar assembly